MFHPRDYSSPPPSSAVSNRIGPSVLEETLWVRCERKKYSYLLVKLLKVYICTTLFDKHCKPGALPTIEAAQQVDPDIHEASIQCLWRGVPWSAAGRV